MFAGGIVVPNINELLREKNQIIEQLNSLLFGSIELRENVSGSENTNSN